MFLPKPIIIPFIGVSLIALALPATGQIPNALLHSIPAPPVGVQSGGSLGWSVAVDGNHTVVGAPADDLGETNSGAVKVFDSNTGNLLFVLANPEPGLTDQFGASVAISGTTIVVGADQDSTGAGFAGSAYVYDLASATPTVPVFTLNNPDPMEGDQFGGSVAISGTRVVVGADQDDTGAYDAGSVYVYDLASGTPTLPVATLHKPGAVAQDRFGESVAISGTRVVVGAYWDDTGANAAGSVYVFDLASATPSVPVVTLNNPSPVADDWFGWSVAISGTRVVVGTDRDDTGASNAGSAYIYDLAGTTPTVPVITLNNPEPAAFEYFGGSVAISGTWVVVGAAGDDVGENDAGSAYVYDIAGSTPIVPVRTLRDSTPAAADYFGSSVAISGLRVVVGEYADDTGANDAGSAYVYDLGSATPTIPAAVLHSPGMSSFDRFGWSVGISGTRVVVGTPFEDTGADNAGSAYVYDLASATPTVPVFTLNNPAPAWEDYFGRSVAISGTRVVVGANGDDTVGTYAGSAYVYDLASPVPSTPVVTLTAAIPAAGDQFGYSVAVSGRWLVVGAFGDDTGASDAGNAYVYDLDSATPSVSVFTLNNPAPTARDRFGSSVAVSGTRVVVGAMLDDAGAVDAGTAYVYDLAGATPSAPVATLNNPSPATSDQFGYSVAISGTRIIIGAYLDDTGATNAGSAYVYDITSATPNAPVATLNNPSPAADWFGYSLAISGSRVVVGVYRDDTGTSDAGTAYVYDLNSGTPTVPVAKLNRPGTAANDNFGHSVTIDGTTIAIGTPGDDTAMPDKGAIYIFGPHPLDQDSDGLLDSWELIYWATTTGHSALDDFDHDGICELLELALGLNPILPDAAGLPTPTNGDDYLTMTITKQAGVSYEVQSAGSLLPALPDSFSATTTTVITNNATTLKVRDNFLVGTTPGRFMRVKVTAAP